MRTMFSDEQIARLKQNPCVFSCAKNSVNYTFEFKKNALELHASGVSAKEIWARSGFDTAVWRKNYFRETLRDWKKIVQANGIEGLLKPGGIQFDRGPTQTNADRIKRLELQNRYLRAENDFLAKLRARRAELSNSGQKKNFS